MRNLYTQRTLRLVLLFLGLSCIGNLYASVGDAGISAISSPTNPVCKGNRTVKAVIHNFGGITISTATIHWTINGVNQTDYNYSGSLTAGSNDTITLGTHNFATGPDTIVAWTANPNGSADSDPLNDSSTSIVAVASTLTGTYTVGGTTPDYADFEAAVAALVANGVCGPVTFNIRPVTDTFQVVIPQITGADSVNTITFQAENGDSSSVVFRWPSQDTLNFNYLIKLDGADFITFKHLSLQRPGIKATARVIEFTNGSNYITITNCRLTGATTSIPNSLTALVYSSSSTTSDDSSNTFKNSLFENGALGIYMNGISTSNLEEFNVIRNNIFVDQYSRGIQMTNQGHAIIEGNTFNTVSTYEGYAAIYLDRSLRPHMITKNKISGVPGTGIYLVDCTAQSGVHGIIANNFIHSSDSAGISIVNGDYQDVVFNSILMTGSTQSFAALFMRGSGTGKIVRNNILANSGGGYCYVISDSAVFGITSSNYNDLFTDGGAFVGQYNGVQIATLANWRTASSQDSNSVSVNPNFATISDLHVTAIAMDDLGKPTSGIMDDIDGDMRSPLTPDIGADEYSSVSRNVGITGLATPMDNTCGSAATVVKVIVSNTGGFPESNFDVVVEISGTITTTLTQTHTVTIQPGTSDTLTFATTIDNSTGGPYNFKIYTSLGVDDIHTNDTLLVSINSYNPPAAPSGTGASICGPGSATISASSPDSIRWYSAATGGTLLGSGASFITPTVAATTPYFAAAVGACESSRTAVTLTVLPVPSINLGNDTSVNQGVSLNLNAGPGFTSYLWSTTQITQTINVNTTGCYWAQVTNASNCTARDTICVTVVQPNDVGVTVITAPKNKDCADDSVQVLLRVKNLGSSPASGIPVTVDVTGAITISYHDTITSSLTPGTDVVLNMGLLNTSAGGVYLVKAFTSYVNDLDHTNDTLTQSDTIIIQPMKPTGIGGARCGQGTVVLVSSSADSVYWYDAASGGNVVFVGDNYVVNNLATTTTFYAQSGNYCNTQDRTPVTATIYQSPPVNFGPDIVIDDSVVLDAGPFYASYIWSDNSTLQTLTVYNSGTYSVCVTDTNGCSNCDTVNVTITVGIEQIADAHNARVFPNPTRNGFTVELNEPANGRVTFVITNVHGQEIIREERENIFRQSFDVSRFARGVYNVQILSDDKSSVYRLILE